MIRKRIASRLRKAANRIDPPHKPVDRPYYGTANASTFHYAIHPKRRDQ